MFCIRYRSTYLGVKFKKSQRKFVNNECISLYLGTNHAGNLNILWKLHFEPPKIPL